MKKILLLITLFALLIYLVFSRYIVQFVWVNPNVNTKVLHYISKSVKEIDKALDSVVLSMRSNRLDIKILYKNAYGSGFLKYNPIPNDLDYSIGVYLGEYEYDGTNSLEIADSIDEKMSVFQTEIYSYINTVNPGEFYSDIDILSSIQTFYGKRTDNVSSVSQSIPKLFNRKDYVVYTEKSIYDQDNNEIVMTFPFLLKQNEILIEDYSPITLFTRLIKYDGQTRDMMRELTIVTDFYVDIKKGDETVNAEIAAESFTGQRLQLTRRFFVPVVFTGNSSADFLKHLNLLTDDDTYIEYRLFNFKRHLQEFHNLKEIHERPVKMFKRILQCTDLILPLLDEQTANDITTVIETNLNNPKIRLVNDYQTALGNLIQMSAMPNLWFKAQSCGNNITQHINMMQQIVDEMKTAGIEQSDIEQLEKVTKEIAAEAQMVNSEEKLHDFRKKTFKLADIILVTIDKIINETVTDKAKILEYINTFSSILEKAGFHKVNICWLDKNQMGIVKDEFTSQISEKDLRQIARENNLPEAEYKFINRDTLKGPKVRYSVWVRYNPSDEENAVWNNIRKLLLEDKANFRLKRRFII